MHMTKMGGTLFCCLLKSELPNRPHPLRLPCARPPSALLSSEVSQPHRKRVPCLPEQRAGKVGPPIPLTTDPVQQLEQNPVPMGAQYVG